MDEAAGRRGSGSRDRRHKPGHRPLVDVAVQGGCRGCCCGCCCAWKALGDVCCGRGFWGRGSSAVAACEANGQVAKDVAFRGHVAALTVVRGCCLWMRQPVVDTCRRNHGTAAEAVAPVDMIVLAVVGDVAHVTICPLLACQSKAPHFATAIFLCNTSPKMKNT